MEIPTIISSVVSFVLGIGVVAKFFGKYLPITKKYIIVASDALDLAKIAIKAAEDKNLTTDEINEIKSKALKLEADFKA